MTISQQVQTQNRLYKKVSRPERQPKRLISQWLVMENLKLLCEQYNLRDTFDWV